MIMRIVVVLLLCALGIIVSVNFPVVNGFFTGWGIAAIAGSIVDALDRT